MIDKVMPYMIPVIVVLMGIIYTFINPIDFDFIPKCPWWLLTNTYCPSCGIQRMLHYLLNGEFILSLKANPFLIISLPYVLAAVIGKWYNFNHKLDGLNRFIYSRRVLSLYVFFYFGWWILRNIIGC